MNEEDLIWSAGFIDGDGSIQISKSLGEKNPYHSLQFYIAQKSKKILEHIKELIGDGSVKKYKDKNAWKFQLSADNASIFLKQLIPYLRIKKLEAQIAVQFQENKTQYCPLSDKEIVWREMHYRLLQYIKRHR